MKNFNIKKIKLKSKKEPSLERKLTGEVISEIKTSNVEPNAELEGEEVIQFPDGVMHTVKGNPHSKGGVKMNIPDGTRILSKVLTLSKKNVSEAKRIFDIDLSTKDSFAKAQEKFEKKIGLKRLFDEQEELFKKLKLQLEKKDVPDSTFRLNQEYLSEKISDIENQKTTKEDVRKQFFEFIFNSQEESKQVDKKNMPKKEDEGMKYGGIFGKFQDGGLFNYQSGGRKPIYITDPKEYKYRKAMYDDSLNLYKAYKMQDKLMGPGNSKIKDKYNKWTPAELKEGRRKRYVPFLKEYVSHDYQSEKDQFKDGYDAWTARPQDQKLIKYYKSLGFTDDNIMYHSSPDVVHPKIRAKGTYHDGFAGSPIYKKPVQPVEYRESVLPEPTVSNLPERNIVETAQPQNTQPIQAPLREEMVLPIGRTYDHQGRYTQGEGGEEYYGTFKKIIDPSSGKVRYVPTGKKSKFRTLYNPTFQDGGESGIEDLGDSEFIPIVSGNEQAFLPISTFAIQDQIITPVDTMCPEGHVWDSNLQMCVKTVQNLDDSEIALFEDGGMVRIDYSKVGNTGPDYGGIGKDKFSALAKKYGLTEEQAINMLNVTKYQIGGQTSETITFVTTDASGKYYLSKIGPGVNVSTAIRSTDIEKNPDGSVKVNVDGSKVEYPLYSADKDGSLSRVSTSPANNIDAVLSSKGVLKSTPPAKTQEAKNIKSGALPAGMSINQYRALQKEYDTPMKIAKGFADGKISSEIGNKLQYDLSNPKDPIVFKTSTAGKSVYADSDVYKRKDQTRSKAAFGEIQEEDVPYVMEYLYRNFPDIVTSEDIFGVKFNPDGTISYNKNLDFSKVLPQVEKFQKRADSRMRSSANTIISNPEMFDAESVKDAQAFLEGETFSEGLKARGFDSKLGNFTSGRYNKGVDVVTPEEREALSKKGIFTVRQLQQEVEKDPTLLSDASKEKLGIVSDIMEEDADFVLNPYKQMEKEPKEQPEETPKKDEQIVGDIKIPNKKMPMRYAVPSYYPLPPSPLQAHFAPQSKFGLIDPVRIGIEQQIQTSGESMRLSADQLQDLAPQQRAAVIAQMQADRQKQLNEAAYQANVTNAQNLSQTELFNVSQRDRQSEADIRNKLNFEQRQYMAMANTEEDIRRYFDRLNDIDMNQFMVNQNLNLINEMTDDFKLAPNMMQAEYAPSSEYQIRGGNPYTTLFGNPYVQ